MGSTLPLMRVMRPSQKTGSEWIGKGLVDLSTTSSGCTNVLLAVILFGSVASLDTNLWYNGVHGQVGI
jgi:hypothetical protein